MLVSSAEEAVGLTELLYKFNALPANPKVNNLYSVTWLLGSVPREHQKRGTEGRCWRQMDLQQHLSDQGFSMSSEPLSMGQLLGRNAP